MIRLLIIDDRESIIQSLEMLIEPEEKIKVVGTAKSGEEGIRLVKQLQPDVAIVDLTMPLKSGIETTYSISQQYPKTKVLILTGSDGKMLNKAILAGAKGYLLKNTSVEDLIAAIYAVGRNSIYIGQGILEQVQLSSVEEQKKKIKLINLWLAKEVVSYWQKYSGIETPSAKQITKDLCLNPSLISWMRNYLCRTENSKIDIREELKTEVEKLFIQIKESNNPDRELISQKPQIHEWISNYNSYNTESLVYRLSILYDNFQSLQKIVFDKQQKTIFQSLRQNAPTPLLICLISVRECLLDWQEFMVNEYDNSVTKEKSALHSLDYLFKAQDRDLSNKYELCEKALVFFCQCRVNAEIARLLTQIISRTIGQVEMYVDSLEKTNALLSESISLLEHEELPELNTLIPPWEEIQQKVLPEKLRYKIEKILEQSLNEWGLTKSISSSEINNYLLKELEPIARQIHADLRKEALAVSFLKYAEYSDRK